MWLIHDVWSIPQLRQLRAAGVSYSSKFQKNLLFRIIHPEVVEAPARVQLEMERRGCVRERAGWDGVGRGKAASVNVQAGILQQGKVILRT